MKRGSNVKYAIQIVCCLIAVAIVQLLFSMKYPHHPSFFWLFAAVIPLCFCAQAVIEVRRARWRK